MDIYQKIKRDHEVHRELMDRISATTGESEERKELFEKLLVDVEAHAAAEEQTLYSEIGLHFWINILLTILGYIPGIIHAIWIIVKR